MSRQILMSVIVIYLCIVNIIYSYKLGNKNVAENNKDIGELCSLIKEGETLSVIDMLGSSEVLSYLQMVKDKQFIYTTSLIIKAYNVLDINTKFTAKDNTDKPTHQISVSLRNSLNYQFINSQEFSLLSDFQFTISNLGLNIKLSSRNSCLFSLMFLEYKNNAVLIKGSNLNELYLMILFQRTRFFGGKSSYVTENRSVTKSSMYDALLFKLKMEITENSSGNITTTAIENRMDFIVYYLAAGIFVLALLCVLKGRNYK